MSAVAELVGALFDDAALFPPGLAPMEVAVPAHRGYRHGPLAPFVGPFLVADTALPRLAPVLAGEDDAEPLRIGVTVPGGADAVGPAVSSAVALAGVRLVAVEAAVAPGDPPVAGTRRTVEALARHLPDGVTGYVEVPRAGDARASLAVVAEAGLRAKYRTGGVRADAFPAEEELAVFVRAAVDLAVPFKCTAGLHHAVRHTAADTGFQHHGFLNVLLAVHAALNGAPPERIAGVLAVRDGRRLAAEAGALGTSAARAIRAGFVSYGTCSVTEPLSDLADLGLLPRFSRV
ncbi:hypothetical protein SAMN02745673_00100 [Marinactinospora thermotolerans DSM 45154]|uniref:Uncharacterized protein n=1 Tax=Marinactinospora thermotolerans DSM 45154 TaxID=1122192 RepID=A0A1T4K0S8_9ACTN|nr:hypothetical protein [Marinactinospora thermotolerans]SJZ36021.1 hypothetical protein SAMN02745673_00100 [Marinactinospora thermotolerans DSM 45154]